MTLRHALTALLALALLAGAAAGDDTRALRLKPFTGEMQFKSDGQNPQEIAPDVAAHLKSLYPAFDADEPACASLVWFYSHWARSPAPGRRAVNEKYANIGVNVFNRCRNVSAAMAELPQPEPWLDAWRRIHAKRIIEERLAYAPERQVKRFADIPAKAPIEQVETPADLTKALGKHIDGFAKRQASLRERVYRVLAEINPGFNAEGWYIAAADAKVAEAGPHVIVPLKDGTRHVNRFELDPSMPLLVPGGWLRREAERLEPVRVEPSAKVNYPEPVVLTLPDALGAGKQTPPLHLHLSYRTDGDRRRLDNAWARTPTISNRVHRVLLDPVADDPASRVARRAELHLAVPAPKAGVLDVRITVEKSGDAWTYKGTRKSEDDEAVEFSGTAEPADAPVGIEAPKTPWPWFLGPNDCGATDAPALVENPEEAKLGWVSEDLIPTGRGPDTRGKVRPMGPNETLSGGWASPVYTTEGTPSVLMSYYEPSGKHYAWGAGKFAAENPDEKDRYRLNLIEADDVIHCFDATTGRTRWRRVYRGEGMSWSGFNKSGPEQTPAAAEGRLFAVGTLGIVRAVDTASGRTMWVNDLGRRHRLLAFQREQITRSGGHYGSRSDFSTRAVVVGPSVVVCDHVRTKGGDEHYRYELQNGLIGFDRATGRRRWHRPGIGSSAGRWVHGGKAYLLAGDRDGVACVDPADGKVLWRIDDASAGLLPLPVWSDRVIAATREGQIACWKLSPSGAEKLWTLENPWMNSAVAAIRDGYAYIPVRKGPTVCVKMDTGEVVGSVAASAGNGFNIVTGERLLVSPDQSHSKPIVGFIRANPGKLEVLKVWNLRLSGAYTTPIYPPMTEGRIFFRLRNRLACYDLRRSAAVKNRPHAIERGSKTARPKKPKPPRDPKKKAGPKLPDMPDLGL